MLGGKWVRKSTREITWEGAEQKVESWETALKGAQSPTDLPTLSMASRSYLLEIQARKLSPATLNKHQNTLNQLTKFANSKGYTFLTQLSVEFLREWRTLWTDGPLTSKKKLERIRSFFKFCIENDWLSKNPASKLKSPIIEQSPTLPFTPEEFSRILSACGRYAPKQEHRERMKAFVLILRWSGLRISDAMQLTRQRIDEEGRLFLYTQKTGTPVKIPLPEEVISSIEILPWYDSDYLFWNQQSSTRILTATGNMRDSLGRLFKLANIENGHAHRFRDTFAVELLQKGVSLEDVSILLGHRSVKITEKHYAPWVKGRQDRLEAAVKKAWA
jgi:integrase/recombinase XerD